ncbi:sulfite exporter TauE/SafE family protein [Rhodospirillum rubrum]|uniref:Probable membrane transporter protein n=1 Tax=Rhodospirillum rubrum (strain ATCC 11170 / ATH 1.1.1 / DSM 467 / LMG 4362 / NCIMB 8255 / S1) TaxID=269796 RepID=Q2RUP6_RHORT|nr:sulfite exporter TauE/SafE family protein [Rhodospirillum rubrum]ABC22149.1 Protein of unknown function DUF81 [Rhodospirillum rubrum ATCC 11170]AEO47863.1 hypothetical protein F11_06965 [Rhodospirillum rubrum F11]MBK5953737.1 anion permease [Rhodospirillum rubrum]QXG81797.1 sulfite exporter TauE/SafE family protein [Rhodospirillum rubrum]HAQ00697.1 sulfite exporter TauE/SafE family protein [Rhodospirillum rubrum]
MTAFTVQQLIPFAIALVVTGAFTGVLAGLLGVGGGIVIVPVLFVIFELFDLPLETAMHIAVGTSLLTIIPTSIASMRAHNRRGAIDWSLVRLWGPFLFFGAALGGIASRFLGGDYLKAIFGILALAVAINMGMPRKLILADALPKRRSLQGAMSAVIGFFSSLMGIGGGTLAVPTLTAFSFPVHRAVGSASAFGLIISVPAMAGFIWSGWDVAGRPPYSLGYVNLVAAGLIVPMSMIMARYGASLAHSLKPDNLKRVFAAFLAITALRMLWTVFSA